MVNRSQRTPEFKRRFGIAAAGAASVACFRLPQPRSTATAVFRDELDAETPQGGGAPDGGEHAVPGDRVRSGRLRKSGWQ